MEGEKFCIVFENSLFPGYTTKKLMHGMVPNTIPIYWGNPQVGKDFNPHSFIKCHAYEPLEDVIDLIKQIDQDVLLYHAYLSEPYLINNQETEFYREENILSRFAEIFSQKTVFFLPGVKKNHMTIYAGKMLKKWINEPLIFFSGK